MDRIDPEPPARAIKHRGEQRAGVGDDPGRSREADMANLDPELGLLHPHPVSEHLVNPHRHFRRAGFGESQAQDLRWRNPVAQQQPQHPRGKHLCFPGPRRGAEPHGVLRIDREQLVIL